MKIFQLDECLNSKKLAEHCNAAAKCNAHRFPKKFKGRSVKDPEVLLHFFSLEKPIITNDEEMLSAHVESIPEVHPGLVIVAFSPENHDAMTDDASAEILEKMKMHLPDWYRVPFDNSILLVTEMSIEVFHKESGRLQSDLYAEYGDRQSERVSTVIERNAQRWKII